MVLVYRRTNPTMKVLVFTICLCALVVHECVCDFYPPVIWHWQNCVFRQLKESYGPNATKEFFMKVLPYNGLNIVCVNDMLANDWLPGQTPDDRYENMWMVDKHGFDNCMVNEKGDPKINKKILTCEQPFGLKRKVFKFHHSYNTEEPFFAPGHHYYFIYSNHGVKYNMHTCEVLWSSYASEATSTGSKYTLDNKKGGHCKTTHMKLHIYVCDPKKEDCIWEMPTCPPPYKMMKRMKQYSRSLPPPTRAPVTVPPPPSTTSLPEMIATKTTAAKTAATKETSRQVDILIFRPSTDNPTAIGNPQQDTLTDNKCKDEEEKGTSIHMILNFVLGAVILFMAVVIVILACGLARRSSDSKGRPTSVAFSAVSQEPSAHLYEETARFIHPPVTPLSKSPPQTPLSVNPPFYLAPMSEIRPRTGSTKHGFNNSVYNKRRHSVDGSELPVESAPILSGNSNDESVPV